MSAAGVGFRRGGSGVRRRPVAGHFGGVEALPHGFAAFVPVGRTYDPDTGLDWEGRGIAPDVQVPADGALDAALARIGKP